MTEFVVIVAIMAFVVNFFLLLGINRLTGSLPGYASVAAAAAVSGLHAGACMLPGFYFLGNAVWRGVGLVIVSGVAFGLELSAIRKGVLHILFSMALSGCMSVIGGRSVWSLALAGGVVLLLCVLGFRILPGLSKYVPVELHYGQQRIRLTALRDTGNTLRDPVTGQPVLVIGPDAAMQLTGLSREQLCRPVEAMVAKSMPGLRLIPYHSIGKSGGMLLAMRLENVRIGQWKGSSLVAFAPDGLGSEEAYQALTGGAA